MNLSRLIFSSSMIFCGPTFAQELKIFCEGSLTISSTIGSTRSEHEDTYEFKNGLLYGAHPAKWSEASISVTLDDQRLISPSTPAIKRFERQISIDRNTGRVIDITKAWRSDIRNDDANVPNALFTFEGKCRRFEGRKF